MHKLKISAKEVFDDIRSGMDDLSLMKKFRLSEKGLRSLYKKLGNIGIIRHLNAHDVVKDLKSGMDSQGLMTKYGLSAEGLQNLFQELDRAHLFNGPADPHGRDEKQVVKIEEIVEDIRFGLTRDQLIQKYGFTPNGLRLVSMKLIGSGKIAWQEVYDRLCSSMEAPRQMRQTERFLLQFDCSIFDQNDPETRGRIHDITEKGLKISGITARTGEMKTLVVPEEPFGEFASFTFNAQCRWSTPDPQGLIVSGFEIAHISMGSLRELKLLIHLAQFSHNHQKQG